jgi:hypothetical protein
VAKPGRGQATSEWRSIRPHPLRCSRNRSEFDIEPFQNVKNLYLRRAIASKVSALMPVVPVSLETS